MDFIWFNKAKQSNSDRHWSKYKERKKLTQKACRTAHLSYVQDLISDDKDSKKLWSYIKSKKKDNTGTSDLKSGQTIIQDAETKANMVNALFTKILKMASKHP